ncbi:hypothetical protein HK096_006444 [Nowakowskiella sp. JEL0078]|nr:hypothetical protein HK096_006444 [Nowakowskiella sp. JEL0078]
MMVSNGVGFVEALLFSRIDSDEPTRPVVRRAVSSTSIPSHFSERLERVRQIKNMDLNQLNNNTLLTAQTRHDALRQEISLLINDVNSYIETLSLSTNTNNQTDDAIGDYSLENPNPDSVNLKASIIRRLVGLDSDFNVLTKIITNIYSRQTLARLSFKFFQSDVDAATARLQMDSPHNGTSGGAVILRLGLRVVNMFSPVMSAMNLISAALLLSPIDLKNATGTLITASSDLLGFCDVFFSQLEKTCRKTAARAKLPVTCQIFNDMKTEIPDSMKNLTDLILSVVFYAQDYWNTGSREGRKQLRLAAQNFEDIFAHLANVVLENANGPTKDDPALVPFTLYWVTDMRHTHHRGHSISSLASLDFQSSNSATPSISSSADSISITPKRDQSLERKWAKGRV